MSIADAMNWPPSLAQIAGLLSLTAAYYITLAVYHIYFDKLSAYPGPKLWAASNVPRAYSLFSGKLPFDQARIHERYGPVVRIGIDELSYIDGNAWNDIHAKTRPQMRKDPEIGPPPPNGVKGLAFAESDEDHNRMRRNLSYGFSEKALRDQEERLNKYFNLLFQRLYELSPQGPVNLVDWLNFTMVDIIGDLTFGQSFGCLESSTLHPWMANIFQWLKAFVKVGCLMEFTPLDKILGMVLWFVKRSNRFAEKDRLHRGFINDRLDARLAKDDPRIDFMTSVQKITGTPTGMSLVELQETCSSLMLGGSETTASALSGTVYHLLRNPPVLERLVEETRAAFAKEGDIDFVSVNNLKYQKAVLQEAMRVFPPLPAQIPRMTSPAGDVILGKFVPGNTYVSVAQWACYHSPSNFASPNDFIPERWLDDPRFAGDDRKAYQPFSVGPRNCIGQNLAWAEMRMILARLIWNFDLRLDKKSEDWLVGLKAWAVYEKSPLWVSLTPVKR